MQKFTKTLTLIQLTDLILANWVDILLAIIDFHKFLYFCYFFSSLVSTGSFCLSNSFFFNEFQ